MNRSIRYVRRIAYALVIGATAAVMLPIPVHAGDAQYPGYAGYLNLWEHTDYKGILKSFRWGVVYDLDLFGFGDKASSVVNKTDTYWLLYDDTALRDRAMCISPHSHYPKLADAGFNDKTSSLVQKGTAPDTSCGHWPIIGIPN